MKANTCILVVLTTLSLCCANCSNSKSIKIQNDESVCQLISGNWSNTVRLESVIVADPQGVESSVADITVLSTTKLTLNKDNTFEIETTRALENFTPTVKDCPFTKQQLAENVHEHLKVEGTYIASKTTIQLTSEKVTLSNSSSVSAEDYFNQNPSFGSVVQSSVWNLKNDILYFGDDSSRERIEYRRSR